MHGETAKIPKLSFQIAISDILELTNDMFSMSSGYEFCKTEELFLQYEILIIDAPTLMLCLLIFILIYLLTAIGLTPGGSSTVHIYTQTVQYSTVHIYTQTVQYSTVHIYTQTVQYSTHLHTNHTQNDKKQTIHRTTQRFWKSAGRAPSWRVIPWHLPYSWGKKHYLLILWSLKLIQIILKILFIFHERNFYPLERANVWDMRPSWYSFLWYVTPSNSSYALLRPLVLVGLLVFLLPFIL
jgi:hypothetical protein